MKKIKEFFTQLINRFLESIKRFLLSNIFLAVIASATIYCIITESFDNPYAYLVMASTLGGLTSFVLTLATEKHNINKGNIINITISLMVAVISYIILHFYSDNNYVILAYSGLIVVELCVSFYLLYFIEDNRKLFAVMVSSLLYCYVMVTTIVAGLSICLLAFEYLIYRFENFEKLYLITAAIFEIFVVNSLFLSYIPTREEKLSITKTYENILHKASLAVYYLLIVILYIYLAKVLITFEMPINKINWFASFAMLFYCLFYLSCQDNEKGLALFHVKYGGLVMIPIFLMQGYALFLRISVYGLTTPRYLSIMFNLIGLAFVVSSFFKKGPKYVFLFMALIVAILSIGPLNMLDVPFYSQTRRMEKILLKNNMLEDQTIIANPDISDEDKQEIKAIYYYLKYPASNKENYITEITDDEFEKVFGFSQYDSNDVNKDYKYCSYSNPNTIVDVEGYKSMEYVEYRDSLEIDGYNIEDYLWSLYNEYGESDRIDLAYQTKDGTKIIFNHINFTLRDEKEITGVYFSCYILRK
ncbi:MAG: DUF4153 domain-containing protein [Bacillota bacterium]|jgi:hypothetical protein|nr:DUF4153 domain-containing protein [Bacillota bacterium]NLL27070.1 DUF4153 domain-containing protein [Erysipelotrichia bacterium]